MVADIPYSDATPGASVPHKIVPYIATYDLMREAKIAGQAKRKLEPLADNNWLLTMNAKANVLLLNFKYTQKTKFKFINDRPRPENYQQIDSGSLKSSKKLKQVFDWQQMLESGRYNKKKWQLDLLPETQNRLTSLINLRVDLLSRSSIHNIKMSWTDLLLKKLSRETMTVYGFVMLHLIKTQIYYLHLLFKGWERCRLTLVSQVLPLVKIMSTLKIYAKSWESHFPIQVQQCLNLNIINRQINTYI